MKSLEVTEEQYEELDAIREALAEDVQYGHVRPRDALQRLLDAHGDDSISVPEVDDDTGTDAAGETAAPDESGETAERDDSADADENETDDEGSADGTSGDGDDKLSAMMNLLDTHDDKWEKADSQETRYVVDLPDGGTEEVQTKDDVKAILFKKY